MKCNRYVGTGLAASITPTSRINRASSDHIFKNKFRTVCVTSKQVPAMHFKARKTSSMPARKINQDEELIRSIEEQVITNSISTVKMKNGFITNKLTLPPASILLHLLLPRPSLLALKSPSME